MLLLGPSGVVDTADTSSLHLLIHDPCLATTHNHVQGLSFLICLDGLCEARL